MNEAGAQTLVSELAHARNQVARTETALRDSRHTAAELTKEIALLRAKVAMLEDKAVPAESYERLEQAYAELEQRFVAQTEDLLARTNDEIGDMNAFLDAVRSSKFWALKDAFGFLRRRRRP